MVDQTPQSEDFFPRHRISGDQRLQFLFALFRLAEILPAPCQIEAVRSCDEAPGRVLRVPGFKREFFQSLEHRVGVGHRARAFFPPERLQNRRQSDAQQQREPRAESRFDFGCSRQSTILDPGTRNDKFPQDQAVRLS